MYDMKKLENVTDEFQEQIYIFHRSLKTTLVSRYMVEIMVSLESFQLILKFYT